MILLICPSVLGDFNKMFYPSEKLGVRNYVPLGYRNLKNFLHIVNVMMLMCKEGPSHGKIFCMVNSYMKNGTELFLGMIVLNYFLIIS